MKLNFSKIITCILICALMSIFYVHQEIEIFKTSFKINKQNEEVSFLLDQYRSLVYNLSRLESPERIEQALSANEITLCMPSMDNIRKVGAITARYEDSHTKQVAKEPFLVRVLDRLSTRAEAKVIDKP